MVPPRDPAARTAGWLLLVTAIATVVSVIGRVAATDLTALVQSLAAIGANRGQFGIGGAARFISGLTLFAGACFLLRTWIMRQGLGSRAGAGAAGDLRSGYRPIRRMWGRSGDCCARIPRCGRPRLGGTDHNRGPEPLLDLRQDRVQSGWFGADCSRAPAVVRGRLLAPYRADLGAHRRSHAAHLGRRHDRGAPTSPGPRSCCGSSSSASCW